MTRYEIKNRLDEIASSVTNDEFVVGVIIFFIVFILAVIYVPFVPIWAINAMFGTTIAYTFKTWLASVIIKGTLTAIFGGIKLQKNGAN